MERVFSLKDTAKFLGVKVRTLRDWIVKGKLIAFKYPDSEMWFVRESEIRRLIKD